MLVLREHEKCPHSNTCKYNPQDQCHGAHTERENEFTCEYVDENGVITEEGSIRNPLDKTGQMELILEDR